jgi:putative PIN family toxin of toxin-antitoxin system
MARDNIAGDINLDCWMRVVADTNVLVSAIRSPSGASGFVLKEMLHGRLEFGLSPALLLEYEDVLKRPLMLGDPPKVTFADVETILDALCSRARPALSYFRFRPILSDPKDDFLIECALASGATIILTSDRHLAPEALKPLGLKAMTPKMFLQDYYRKETQ